jgi:hypothetical protein
VLEDVQHGGHVLGNAGLQQREHRLSVRGWGISHTIRS